MTLLTLLLAAGAEALVAYMSPLTRVAMIDEAGAKRLPAGFRISH